MQQTLLLQGHIPLEDRSIAHQVRTMITNIVGATQRVLGFMLWRAYGSGIFLSTTFVRAYLEYTQLFNRILTRNNLQRRTLYRTRRFMESILLRYSLRQLRYFVVSGDTLSFTTAARQLHISQPSISSAISELENSFGIQLFIRHHASGLSLTPGGRDLLGQARNLLKNAEELQTAARDIGSELTGTISLGCMVSLAPPIMASIMSHFLAENPGINFRTMEGNQDDLFNALNNGTLDIALTYSLDLNAEIAFTPFIMLPPYVILKSGHRLSRRKDIALADLLDEPYVLLDLPHSREYFASLFDPLGRRPVPTFKSAQPEVVRGMVAHGLGFSILNFPLRSTSTVDAATFAIRSFRDNVTALTLGIAMAKSMKPRKVVLRFAQFCEAFITERHGAKPAI